MKIAVCFFGIPRYAKKGKILNKKFYDGMEIDYYAHFWEGKDFKDIQSLYDFKSILVEDQKDFSAEFEFDTDLSKTTRDVHNSVSPLYSLMQVGKLIVEDYDYVVVTRTDVACLSLELKDFLKNNQVFYTSYVPGNEWIINGNDDHIDFKFFCSSKDNILYLSSLYKKLKKYLKDDRIPLCHHRLLAYHLKKEIKDFSMIFSESEKIGGWYFIRNNNLSGS
jgi:hypothetical protein